LVVRVEALVVGLPLDASQRPTAQGLHCRRYGLRLARSLQCFGHSLPLAWVDEHASSWAAGERFGLHGDRSGRLDLLEPPDLGRLFAKIRGTASPPAAAPALPAPLMTAPTNTPTT
jgi:hypothetical protein